MLKTPSGLFRAQSRKVKGRSWAHKLLTLLLTLFLLLSFSLSAFAWPAKYLIRDLDETGYPQLKSVRLLVIPFGLSRTYFVIVRIESKSRIVSDTDSDLKQSKSPQVDEQI